MRILRDLGEAGAIALMAEPLGGASLPEGWVGIGDDAAVTSIPAEGRVLTTCDVLAEDIHFRRTTTAPEDLGWKALAVNVSDIHGMGGTPAWAVVGLSLPADLPIDWVKGLYRGFADAAKALRTPIVGGDTVGSTGAITISVTVVGIAARPRLRSDARPGDIVVATGPWGLSRAGLWVLEHADTDADSDADSDTALRRAVPAGAPLRSSRPLHSRPLARESAAPEVRPFDADVDTAIGHHRRPGLPGFPAEFAALERMALLDDSDGLATSCALIAAASEVAIELDPSQLASLPAVAAVASVAGVDARDWQLWGGEDYGLVAAIPPEVRLPSGWMAIGRVVAGQGVSIDGRSLALTGAYRHF
jgi:thiamine-monophosphate kinase